MDKPDAVCTEELLKLPARWPVNRDFLPLLFDNKWIW